MSYSQTSPTEGKSNRGQTQAEHSPNLRVALDYAATDIPIFPCGYSGRHLKHPLVTHGHHAATTDAAVITPWWRKWPSAIVGIPTGFEAGLWVLDVDGQAGRQSLNALLAQLGLTDVADLTRVVSRTPSGGLHLIFKLQAGERPRTRASDIGPGLDTRGVKADGSSGGYFIAPGSILPDGRRYELIDPACLMDAEDMA